jgi:integrase
VIEDK